MSRAQWLVLLAVVLGLIVALYIVLCPIECQ